MHGSALHPDRLVLRLPVCAENVGVGRRAATGYAAASGCDEMTTWRVQLSVSEALSNVVLHAHPPGEAGDAHFALSAEADARALRVTVSDEGTGLRSRADSPGMGLGLALIADSCDELSLDSAPAGGTVVRMTFLR